MAGELGLQGLAVPEEYGGSGFGYVDLGIVFEEAGRALLCGPYFATVALAAETLLRCEDEQAAPRPPARASRPARRWPRWRSPRTSAAGTSPASGSPPTTRGRVGGSPAPRPTSPTATSPTSSWSPPAPPPASASSRSTPTLRAWPAPRSPPSTRPANRPDWTSRTPPPGSWAPKGRRGPPSTRPRHRLRAARRRTGRGSGRRAGRGRGLRQDPRAVRTADRLVPGDQAQVRRHAGGDRVRPLGRVRRTVGAGRDDEPRPRSRRPSPRPSAPRRSPRSPPTTIQVHGGIGFTWEHPAHLYFKRAKSSEMLLGPPSYHRELLATRLGI